MLRVLDAFRFSVNGPTTVDCDVSGTMRGNDPRSGIQAKRFVGEAERFLVAAEGTEAPKRGKDGVKATRTERRQQKGTGDGDQRGPEQRSLLLKMKMMKAVTVKVPRKNMVTRTTRRRTMSLLQKRESDGEKESRGCSPPAPPAKKRSLKNGDVQGQPWTDSV